MTPGVRKLALSAHLTLSIGWIGAAAAYLALAVSGATSADVQRVRATWIALELIGWFVIMPLALGALATGIVMAVGTNWGLLRHYWVVFSFTLTLVAAAVVVLHMPSVSVQADAAQAASQTRLAGFGDDIFHSGAGLVLLLLMLVLNMYKPRGMTRYGRRKQAQGT